MFERKGEEGNAEVRVISPMALQSVCCLASYVDYGFGDTTAKSRCWLRSWHTSRGSLKFCAAWYAEGSKH